jgi:hypothetical protein
MTPAQQLRQRAAACRRLSMVVLDWQYTAPRKREWQERGAVAETVCDAEAMADFCDEMARWLEMHR